MQTQEVIGIDKKGGITKWGLACSAGFAVLLWAGMHVLYDGQQVEIRKVENGNPLMGASFAESSLEQKYQYINDILNDLRTGRIGDIQLLSTDEVVLILTSPVLGPVNIQTPMTITAESIDESLIADAISVEVVIR